MMSYIQAAPEQTTDYGLRASDFDSYSDYCDYVMDVLFENYDMIYHQYGSDGPPMCQETFEKRKEEMREKQCADMLPKSDYCAIGSINCTHDAAPIQVAVCLRR